MIRSGRVQKEDQIVYYAVYPIGGKHVACNYKGQPLMSVYRKSATAMGGSYFGSKNYEIRELKI